jgi:kynurenine formamidase
MPYTTAEEDDVMQSGWLQQFMTRKSDDAPSASPTTEAAGGGVSRRGFMQRGLAAGVAAGSLAAGSQVAQAQTPPATGATPIGQRWWPSRWGPQDQAGASNHMTPAKVLAASKLIKTGKVYNLDHPYETGIPAFGARVFALRIPGTPSGGPFGKNKLCYHDEFVATEIGQIGTQFDGLGHIGCIVGKEGDMTEMRYYNGITEAEMADGYGLKKLGMEHVKPFFTRAVLIDVAGLKGRMLNAGEEITVADVQAALKRQNIAENSFTPGDAIFFHTGWSSLWMKDNAKYNSGEPGIGLDVARWLISKEIALTGADTWATEVVPNPDKDMAFVVHNELITKHGIFNHENLDFTEVLADKLYEFVYVFSPLRIKGATGSPGHPIAIG